MIWNTVYNMLFEVAYTSNLNDHLFISYLG